MFYHKNPPPHLATPEIGVTVYAKKLAGALLKSVHKKKGRRRSFCAAHAHSPGGKQ
jgi:hypothetical protein